MHFILHLSTWHSKPALPPKLLLLLNYNFVRSGSVQYRRQSEISLKDRAVSPPASITCTAAPSRQLISRGLCSQPLSSKDLEPDRKFPPKTIPSLSAVHFCPLVPRGSRAGSSSVSRSLSVAALQWPSATSDPHLFGPGALSAFITVQSSKVKGRKVRAGLWSRAFVFPGSRIVRNVVKKDRRQNQNIFFVECRLFCVALGQLHFRIPPGRSSVFIKATKLRALPSQ